MLSVKEEMVFDAIKSYINLHCFPPTVRELAKLTGLRSTSNIYACLENLEEKGFIERMKRTSRGIRIVKSK